MLWSTGLCAYLEEITPRRSPNAMLMTNAKKAI